MSLRGVVGGGYEVVDDSFTQIPRTDRRGQYSLMVTGMRIIPAPIEEWVLRNCPLLKEYALAARSGQLRKDVKKERYLVAFCVPAEGVGEREAETALLEVVQRLKPRQRPKRLAWVKSIPKVHPDQGGGYDRIRLKYHKDISRCQGRFNEKTNICRGKGSRLKVPAIRGASNQWQMEGFLRYHPVGGREAENKEFVSIVIAHVDSLTREERKAAAIVTNKRLASKVRNYKRGYRVSVVGHFGKHGRLVCDQIVHITENMKKVPLGDIDTLAEALV